MKVRTGFVSNSSSTSFTICGVHMDNKNIVETFKVEDPYDLEERGENQIQVIHNFNWEDHYYIGMIFGGEQEHCKMTCQMKDDETKEEFRLRVKKVLSDEAGKEIECSFHSASWYNG